MRFIFAHKISRCLRVSNSECFVCKTEVSLRVCYSSQFVEVAVAD